MECMSLRKGNKNKRGVASLRFTDWEEEKKKERKKKEFCWCQVHRILGASIEGGYEEESLQYFRPMAL